MAILYVNNTYRVTVSFSSWDETTQSSSVEDPTGITATEYSDSIDVANIVAGPTAPTLITPGQYYYDYTPSTLGTFLVVFDAQFTGSDDEQVVYQFDIVKDGSSSSSSAVFSTLIEDQTLEFSSGMDPLYMSPEDLVKIFPEAGLLEAAEYIHYASLEVLDILKTNATDTSYEDLPFVATEYVKAAAACALSRVYEDGGNELSIRLGDMSVTNPGGSAAGRYVNRGNASTWCQLAAALRNELLDASTLFGSGRGSRSFQRGIKHANPMPDRTILYTGEARTDTADLRENRKLSSFDD